MFGRNIVEKFSFSVINSVEHITAKQIAGSWCNYYAMKKALERPAYIHHPTLMGTTATGSSGTLVITS